MNRQSTGRKPRKAETWIHTYSKPSKKNEASLDIAINELDTVENSH